MGGCARGLIPVTTLRPTPALAREMLLVGGMKSGKDPNQGEGDKRAARRYNRKVREFVAHGKVDEAAREAAHDLAVEPADAWRAEERARRGPRSSKVSVDELVAQSRTVLDRLRSLVDRAVERVRARLHRRAT